MLWTWGDIVPTSFGSPLPETPTPPTPVAVAFTPSEPEYIDHAEAAIDRLCQFLKPE